MDLDSFHGKAQQIYLQLVESIWDGIVLSKKKRKGIEVFATDEERKCDR